MWALADTRGKRETFWSGKIPLLQDYWFIIKECKLGMGTENKCIEQGMGK